MITPYVRPPHKYHNVPSCVLENIRLYYEDATASIHLPGYLPARLPSGSLSPVAIEGHRDHPGSDSYYALYSRSQCPGIK